MERRHQAFESTSSSNQLKIKRRNTLLMKYRLSQKVKSLWIDANEYWSFKSPIKFLVYFLAAHDKRFDEMDYTLNVFDIQDEVVPPAEKGQLNVMTCIENCVVNTHYAHHTKYGDYGDPNIDIYVYNHIDEMVKTDKYLAIPFVWLHLSYFQRFYETIKPSPLLTLPRSNFAIIMTPNFRNSEVKQNIVRIVNKVGPVHSIVQYRQGLYNESLWFTPTMVNFLHSFKFVIMCENSEAPGYITEKIFAPLFSRCIPIYWGNNPQNYFQDGCYVNSKELSDDELYSTIRELDRNDDLYQKMLEHPKIKPEANIDYVEPIVSFIKEKCSSVSENNV